MFRKFCSVLFLLIILIISSSQTKAALITYDVGYTGPSVDLSEYANGSYTYINGDVVLPNGMTFTANPFNGGVWGLGSFLGQASDEFGSYYDLGDNGRIDTSPVFAALDDWEGFIQFTLLQAVSSFGVYLNYAPDWGDPIISALDQNGNVLENYNMNETSPVVTPDGVYGVNYFEFRGIERSIADIYGLRFENSFIVVKGAQGSEPPAAVPETAVVTLLILGLVSLLITGMVARKSAD